MLLTTKGTKVYEGEPRGSGALFCFISTYWNIAFIVLVQIYYVLALRILGKRSEVM